MAADDPPERKARPANYDTLQGDADLYEGVFRRRAGAVVFGGALVFAVVVCAALAVLFGGQFLSSIGAPFGDATHSITPLPTHDGQADALSSATLPFVVTNTSRPGPAFATVTLAPPTETLTPTPGPCIRQVGSGDTLLGLAASCGHRDLSIIDVIVATNSLSAPEAILAGQEIIIPWPTPTPDPNQPNAPTEAAAINDGTEDTPQNLEIAAVPGIIPTETLQPGVEWHTVRLNETMLSIAFQYGANAEILSQLNPEVPFLQCDFSLDSGGPRCIVQLIEGQRIRVPAPTPTPTIPPTPSGSETPTPSATPTFNAPSALSPGDRALFQRDQLITLRWVTTGTLGPNDVYRVRVRDLTVGQEYTGDTRELFFIVRPEWQGTDARRHEYEWSVSVINLEQPDVPIFTTDTRFFLWESTGTGNS